MSTFSIFLILIVLVSFLLVIVVMVQNPKGGGLSSSFGGGNSNVVGGVQKTGDFLDKSTWTLATILIALILLSNVSLYSGKNSSDSKLIDGVEAPAPANNDQTMPVNTTPAAQQTPQDSTK